MKKRRSSEAGSSLTVIGVIENLAGGTGFGGGGATFYSSNKLVSKIAGEDVPNDTYYFSLKNKENASDYSQRLEKIFIANGMNAESLLDNIEQERETSPTKPLSHTSITSAAARAPKKRSTPRIPFPIPEIGFSVFQNWFPCCFYLIFNFSELVYIWFPLGFLVSVVQNGVPFGAHLVFT